jgi:hypothetical protein
MEKNLLLTAVCSALVGGYTWHCRAEICTCTFLVYCLLENKGDFYDQSEQKSNPGYC